ncbi:PAS domain-containing protein [Fluviibacterium sp. DFM31]|uniref:PAS domain-containing protein n=1 Tax=Meridianimarinicoccus marinus TaxID=3231483 RepID=A0ABV3L7D8_9RHOB
MKHPALAQIEAYWEALRGDRITPLRSEVDPRGIDRALEHAFILERIAPGVARFRLAGMHLNDLMGMEVRGMPVTSFIAPKARDQISDALEHVFEAPARARIRLTGSAPFGASKAEAEMVLLPLRSDLGDISRALGCLVSHGISGKPPHRFGITSVDLDRLSDDEPRTQDYRQTARDEPAPALEERQAPYAAPRPVTAKGTREQADDNADGARHLRLVHNRED